MTRRKMASFVLGALLLAGARLIAVDFVRGDANGDGVVSISDAFRVLAFLFHSYPPPDCMRSADVNDSGVVDSGDVDFIWSFLLLNGLPPPWPFPSPGRDVTHSGEIDCEAYGGGTALEDPAAELKVLDSVVAGGRKAQATITLTVSNSSAIAGFSGRLRVAGDILASVESTPVDLTGTTSTSSDPWVVAFLKNDTVRFGLISSSTASPEDTRWIPAGQGAAAIKIRACVKSGTQAGDYPVTLESGELIDATSGRAIHPSLVAGKITISAKLRGDCTSPFPAPQDGVNAMFKLGQDTAAPGSDCYLPFIIAGDSGIQGYSFSVDFDEEVVEATKIEQVWQKPDGSPLDFQVSYINNDNVNPGNGGVDEGFAIGAAVLSFTQPVEMPAKTDIVAYNFYFHVKPEATRGTTDITFLSGGKFPGSPGTDNNLTMNGKSYSPDFTDSFLVVDGLIQVQPDITIFIRGDSNGDEKVNISDAIYTLGYLFLGAGDPACFDAADADDNGKIDLSDPVATLNFLFFGTGSIPPPFPEKGKDPTADTLGCLVRV